MHRDLNEFTLIVEPKTSKVTLIDFPQMVSTKHPNAVAYFERDVKGLHKFFTMKLKYDLGDAAELLDLDAAEASDPETRSSSPSRPPRRPSRRTTAPISTRCTQNSPSLSQCTGSSGATRREASRWRTTSAASRSSRWRGC